MEFSKNSAEKIKTKLKIKSKYKGIISYNNNELLGVKHANKVSTIVKTVRTNDTKGLHIKTGGKTQKNGYKTDNNKIANRRHKNGIRLSKSFEVLRTTTVPIIEAQKINNTIDFVTPKTKTSTDTMKSKSLSETRRSTLLRQLQSDLSSKYVSISPVKMGNISRYGRQQKFKEQIDFLPSDILYSPRKSPKLTIPKQPEIYNPHLKLTPPAAATTKAYISPIDKLININRMLSNKYHTTEINTKNNKQLRLNKSLELPHVTKILNFDIGPTKDFLPIVKKTIIYQCTGITPLIQNAENIDILPVMPSDRPASPSMSSDVVNFDELETINKFVDQNPKDEFVQIDSCPSVSNDSAKGSSIDVELDNMWKIGQLAWGRVGTFPYWPCLICPDEMGNYMNSNKIHLKIHVRFFADNGRRSWIISTSIFPFKGSDDFEEKKKALPSKLRKKDQKFRAFTVNSRQQTTWRQAIVEAQMIATFPLERRINVFEEMLKEESKAKKISRNLKRYSIASQDFSFDSLFTEIDRRITSTPCALRDSFNDLLEKNSRCVTPESPDYEELTLLAKQIELDVQEENKTSRVKNYLLSLSENMKPSKIPMDDDLITIKSEFHATNESFKQSRDSHLKSEMIPTQLNLTALENDKEFLDFYQHTKQNILGDCDKASEILLKQLALKMWMLKLLKNQQSKIVKPKTTILSTSNSSDVSYIDKNQRRSIRKKIPNSKNVSMENLIYQASIESKNLLKEEKAARKAERFLLKQNQSEEEIEKYLMKLYPKNLLFKGLSREFVCNICLKPNDVLKCSGSCGGYVHKICADNPNVIDLTDSLQKKTKKAKKFINKNNKLGNLNEESKLHITGDNRASVASEVVKCIYCKTISKPICFVCKISEPELDEQLKCTEKTCGRYYHMACLKYWPQNKIVYSSEHKKSLLCPCHVCHTCISDDPRGKHYQIENKKLTKCVKCPATYHIDSCCIPAGTELLTMTQLICPRHRVENRKPVNANWCFICAEGGKLICCETCPTVFHVECLKIQSPDKYICEECETGRLPLYGEIVWGKIGVYRWWPSIILPPSQVPENVEMAQHRKHDFCLRFFGSNNYSWIGRSFVFLYQEGDSDCDKIEQNSRSTMYEKALLEAKNWYAKIKLVNSMHHDREKDKLLPFPYTKLKSNRPVPPVKLNEVIEETEQVCDCKETDEDPCGPNTGCLNRLLMAECNPNYCAAKFQCQNQNFQKRLYPSLVERRIEGKGWGLITLDSIKAGTFVIEYVGEIINNAEFERRVKKKQEVKDEHYYFLTVTRDLMIDAGPKGNLARFINHSCEPNCETQKWQVYGNTRVGLFAMEDISANTELTFNYFFECIGDKKICHCGAEKCSGYIGAKYIDQDILKAKKNSKSYKKSKNNHLNEVAKKKKKTAKKKIKKDIIKLHQKPKNGNTKPSKKLKSSYEKIINILSPDEIKIENTSFTEDIDLPDTNIDLPNTNIDKSNVNDIETVINPTSALHFENFVNKNVDEFVIDVTKLNGNSTNKTTVSSLKRSKKLKKLENEKIQIAKKRKINNYNSTDNSIAVKRRKMAIEEGESLIKIRSDLSTIQTENLWNSKAQHVLSH